MHNSWLRKCITNRVFLTRDPSNTFFQNFFLKPMGELVSSNTKQKLLFNHMKEKNHAEACIWHDFVSKEHFVARLQQTREKDPSIWAKQLSKMMIMKPFKTSDSDFVNEQEKWQKNQKFWKEGNVNRLVEKNWRVHANINWFLHLNLLV